MQAKDKKEKEEEAKAEALVRSPDQ